jgi:signal transduction histidine kinase
MIDETLHELNTPIATIDANVTMLKKTLKNEKELKRVQRIQNASLNLKKLYESIEYNIKEEIEYIEKTTFDIREIIIESIEKTKEIKNKINIIDKTSSLYINTDKNGFERVIDNLLSNAIKYNRANGYVKIYLNDKILTIEDSGIGIDMKNLFIVFEKSYQENPTTQGFGIGLSIVKSFCDKHNIKLKIDTKKDIGTKISLDLKNLTIT